MATAGHVPLASQVGGHPGVLTTEDGSLLIKPALQREVAFYQTLSAAPSPQLAALCQLVPRFYGTLTLAGRVDPSRSDDPAALKEVLDGVEGPQQESIVLENLQYAYSKPNILDIKLGTVLYDEDATPEKRARMEKSAQETTSLETGIRITGFQVYDLGTNTPHIISKQYGKSLKPADLSYAFARIFPLSTLTSSVSSSQNSSSSSPPPSAMSAFMMDRSTSISSTSSTVSTPSVALDASDLGVGTGLPADVLLPMMEGVRDQVRQIREALARVEMRMVGASLLIVHEADWDRARAGLKLVEEMATCEQEEGGEKYGTEAVEAEVALDEDELEVEEAGDEDNDEEDEDDDEDEDEEICRPYAVKLIDFAHARFVPGKGPDEGVLKGLDTVIRLLDGRIQEVRRFQSIMGEETQ